MDFSYAPPPPAKGKRRQLPGVAQKKQKTNDFADLPTYLPNTGSNKNSESDELRENPSTTSEAPVASKESVKSNDSVAPKEPIFIEGTNITLQTDDDIAKWIEERRKNWPTRKNVELKAKREQERKAPETEKTVTKQACKFYARNKKCKFGTKCRNLHEVASNASLKTINGIQVAVPQRYKKEMQLSGSLYKNLVQRDQYEHENNIIIDFLQFLDKNNLIDRDASV